MEKIDIVEDDYMKIYLNGKKGGFAMVDPDDYELVSQYKWHQNEDGYAKGMINNKTILMHRLIMNPSDREVVDHLYHNKLDNRKLNLKVTTSINNSKNRKKTTNKKSSQYKNVCYYKNDKKYVIDIRHDNIRYTKCYDIEIDAAIAVDMYIIHNKLEYNLNFPNDREKYLHTEYIPSVKKEKTSKYYGVNKDKKRFYAKLRYNNVNNNICSSNNEIECAKAYDKYIIDNNIPCRKLNFPEEYPNYNPNWEIKTLGEKLGNNVVKLLIANAKDSIPLVDEDDYEKIKYYFCTFNVDGYVYIPNYNGKRVFLHRLLMNFPESHLHVDHKDSNKGNNTKGNLHITTPQRNSRNRIKKKNTSSQYIGVSYTKCKTWTSQVVCDSNLTYLGSFKIEGIYIF